MSNRESRKLLRKSLNNIKQYVFVIKQINYKENKRKVDETNLGVIWNLLNPLIYMIILSTYYEQIITHDDVDNYPIFVFTGITLMNFYRDATKRAMHSLVSNKTLLCKTHIPTEIFICQKIVMAFREMMFSAVALLMIMFIYKIPITYRIVQMIPILILTTATVFGIGELLAVIYTYFADIDYLYSVFMTMMLFASSVFIPLSHMPEKLQGILTYNPIFLSIYITRNSLVYNLPSHWTAWLKLTIWAVFTVLLGHYVLQSNKNKLISML